MRYLVVVEKGSTSFGAYVPDLPGCIAVGETREDVLASIHEAIEFHLDGLKEDGQPIPPPSSSSEIVEVAAQPRGQHGRPPAALRALVVAGYLGSLGRTTHALS